MLYRAGKKDSEVNALKSLFIKTNNVKRSSYIWNTMSALLYALQSAIVLLVITRTNGIDDAGVFSIAYAVGSLMYFIGEYGVRKYQVTDVNEVLSFTDYHAHRVVACAVTVIASTVYTFIYYLKGEYSGYKAFIVFMVCMIKVVEAYSEVYFGRYQQVGRLDVSAKTNLFRTIVGMAAFMVSLAITHDMALSMTVWLIAVIIAFMMSSLAVMKDFATLEFKFRWNRIWKIFRNCFPLFAGFFMMLYVSNAPKYAIDACMTDRDQACYNFIFMPVFAVGLFANFIFNPIIVDLARKWGEGEKKGFTKIVIRQIFVIFAITLLAIAVALTIGCPVLGIMYNTDLSAYRTDLAILMIGGGMLAYVNFFPVVITVMRKQRYLTIGYIVLAVLAGLTAEKAVSAYGIRGATVLYTSLTGLLAVAFALMTFFYIKRSGRRGPDADM